MADSEQAKVTKLRRELEEAERRAEWEIQHPEAIADAFQRGRQDGWSQGWQDACKFMGQWVLSVGDLHRTAPPEPLPVSFEKIAAFLAEHRTDSAG